MTNGSPPLTEAQLLDRLKVRYTQTTGNGEAWAFIPHVRSAAAFDAKRTIDAYAMSLWPSRGLALHAFECKSSRTDWRRELANPAKAEEFCLLADYFWLTVGAKDIVQPGELPETWGLLVPHGQGLKVAIAAARLRPADSSTRHQALPPAFGRSYLAALLRSATAVGNATPQDILDAEQRGEQLEQARTKRRQEDYKAQFHALDAKVKEFEKAAGFGIGANRWGIGRDDPAKVGDIVKRVLAGDASIDDLTNRLTGLREQALNVHAAIDRILNGET